MTRSCLLVFSNDDYDEDCVATTKFSLSYTDLDASCVQRPEILN